MKGKKIIAALCALAMVFGSSGGLPISGLRLFDTAVMASAAGGIEITAANVICQQYSYFGTDDETRNKFSLNSAPPVDVVNISLADAQAFGADVTCPTAYWVVVYAKDGDNYKWTSNGKTGEQTSSPNNNMGAWDYLLYDDVFSFADSPDDEVTFYFSKGLAIPAATDISTATVNLAADNSVSSIQVGDDTINDLSDFDITYGTDDSHTSTTVPTEAGTYYAYVTPKDDNTAYTGTAKSAAFTIAKTVPYIGYTYDDNGITASSENQCETYTSVTSSTTAWNNGWYVVDSDVTISSRVNVNGNNVHLILCDGCTLTAPEGIQVASGKSLAIYGQSESTSTMGTLISKNSVGESGNAGIGGNKNKTAGTIIINGGKIYTCGSKIPGNTGAGAGIGGGYKGAGGTVYINGGFISIPQVKAVAGIGGGTQAAGGKIVINGGTVSAGSYAGSAIGCGWNSSGATVYINGGTVNANTYTTGWGIGGANSTVRITGGTVSASGNSSGYAIGGTKAKVTITGGTVTAYSQKYNAIEQPITFGSNMTARAGTENDFNKALPCFDYPSKKGKYVRVWEHTHSLSYECEGNHFAVKCANDNCNLIDGELGLTLYADDKEYDGKAYDLQHSDCDSFAHTFADEFKLLTGDTISIGAIELYSDENKIDDAVDPGKYIAKQTVRVNNEEYTVEKSFNIIETAPIYTITIPATVSVDGGMAEFTAENVTLPDGSKINISIDGSNTENGETTFNAMNEAEDSIVTYMINNGDTEIADGGTALTFTEKGTQTLTLIKTSEPTYAGTHTEVLTFGIAVE